MTGRHDRTTAVYVSFVDAATPLSDRTSVGGALSLQAKCSLRLATWVSQEPFGARCRITRSSTCRFMAKQRAQPISCFADQLFQTRPPRLVNSGVDTLKLSAPVVCYRLCRLAAGGVTE